MQVPDSRTPSGPLADKWDNCRNQLQLISPNNKPRYRVIVVGSGLAGASAAATMAELGYRVELFTFHDSPRRAHSIAAQGGINAAKNYRNDGDSIQRLFYDTIKGGDFRSREANVYRLAQVSGNIIDQCVAQGVPFARDYGGYLDNRSFGGTLVSRTFYARGQTGQQLLLGAYGAMNRQIHSGRIKLYTRSEMLDLVVVNGRARGIIVRHLVNGQISRHIADAVVLATGGYSNIYYLSTNAAGCNVTATWRAYQRGALFANPCFTQIHPTCTPLSHPGQAKLTLMSESLRNHGRLWVPQQAGDSRPANDIPLSERDYFLERKYPAYGNLSPRDIASRAVKEVCDEGRGVGAMGRSVYLDFADAIATMGREAIEQHYANLFEMYQNITHDDPWQVPMQIYPAPHYTMGGLWVDYHLMSSIPGLFVIGEANFSDHGANRLGASALMQGLADGYFILPQTIGDFLAQHRPDRLDTTAAPFIAAETDAKARMDALLAINGRRSVTEFHRQLGEILWQGCGMSRSAASLQQALTQIEALEHQFWHDLALCGHSEQLNQSLERAGRVADFMQFAKLMCLDALQREESCGAHFREEFQSSGEAARNDTAFSHVACWYRGEGGDAAQRLTEPLQFDNIALAVRNYK
ncbi:fumarate reductase/succinate dehydrogenase flavoprotein subunit [Ectothiorhodospiraceae bacterium BW-2]|nr:fumarate reductase/succinate dehydrogenase flavoprotein subunit [Ectothiorhodospiraceae bacterium BW-2]